MTTAPTQTAAQSTRAADTWPSTRRIRPRVLLIGAQKSGTTSLFKYLKPHPNFRKPKQKELHYFDLHYDKQHEWYAKQFPRVSMFNKHAATMDASTGYLVIPAAAKRAHALLPDATIVAILRNPVSRAISHYKHNIRRGRIQGSFEQTLNKADSTIQAALASTPKEQLGIEYFQSSYKLGGQYAEHLQRWLEYYPASQIRVFHAESFFNAPQPVVDKLTDDLSIPRHTLKDTVAHNASAKSSRSITKQTLQQLQEHYAPHNAKLTELLTAHSLHSNADWQTDGSWPRIV